MLIINFDKIMYLYLCPFLGYFNHMNQNVTTSARTKNLHCKNAWLPSHHCHLLIIKYDSSSLTNEKDHHYFLNSADVCW